eukprot:gene3182-3484_t
MQNQEILSLAGLRIDGRRHDELRRLQHRIGLVAHADGSAYMEQGLNKVLVAVLGPQEPRKKNTDGSVEKCNIVCRINEAPFAGSERKVRKPGDRRMFEIEKTIREVAESVIMMDLYPRSEITIVVHILETDGSVTCTAINAMCLALMQAGISMEDMVTACTVGYVKDDLCIDLTQTELGFGGAYMPVVIKARSEEIVFMQLDSRLSVDLLQQALEKSLEGCRFLKTYVETAMKTHMASQLENAAK